MNEIFFAITYPPIPITQVGPVAFSLHGVFAAVGFYFGSTYAIKLCQRDGHDDQLFSDAFTWAIFGAIIGARFFTICLLYTSPSPRDATLSRMPSSA